MILQGRFRLVVLAVCMTLGIAPALCSQGENTRRQKHSAGVFGVFVDQEGRPVGGVRVLNRWWPGDELDSISGTDGRFEAVVEWDTEKGGVWYEGYARRFGHALQKFRADLRAGQELDLGRITMKPGGALRGRVLDERGKPLSEARVVVIDADEHGTPSEEKQTKGPAWDVVSDRGSTDEHGVFEIVGIPPGRWYVVAKHESTWWLASRCHTVEAGEAVRVQDLATPNLPERYRIEGVVLTPDDKAVVGAEIRTTVPSPDGNFGIATSTESDAAGSFVLYLEYLPRSTVDLRIDPRNEEYDDVVQRGIGPGARDVVIRVGSTRELNLHVVDEHGQGVEIYGWGLVMEKPSGTVMTGSSEEYHKDGHASLRVPDCPFELEIRSDAHNLKKVGKFEVGTLPDVVEVELSSAAAISGRVTFEGRPVQGVFVELVQRDVGQLLWVIRGRWNGLYYGVKGSHSYTDERGRFHIANDFPHLTYYARAWAEGYAEGLSGPTKVGDENVHVELGLGGAIKGTIRLPGRLSAQGVELEIYRDEIKPGSLRSSIGKIFRGKPNADGKYMQEHLDPGLWLLRVHCSGTLISDLGWEIPRVDDVMVPHVLDIEAGRTTRHDIDLGTGKLCRLRGRLSVGNKIREGYCRLLTEGSYALEVSSSGVDEKGGFEVVAREPGIYRLVIDAGPGHHQYKTVTDLVELSSGENTWERDLPISLWEGRGIRLDDR